MNEINDGLHSRPEDNVKQVNDGPITVAARSKAWNVFARSGIGIVGSNSTQGMDKFVLRLCYAI
jgi:hypothetical protein